MRELEYPFDPDYLLKKKKSIKKQLLENTEGFVPVKVAVLGGSTTHDIVGMLELFLLNNRILPSFYESEYNMFYEDIMFENEELKAFAPDLIYIHTSNRNIVNWPEMGEDEATVESKKQAVFKRFAGLWDKAFSQFHCPIIQNNFEFPYYRIQGNKDATDIHGRVYFVNELNRLFGEYARTHGNFYIHDIQYESALYGLEKWSDPFYWHMYKYAMCVPAIPYTAYGVANIIKSVYGKNKKILALDMDNTLWGGVIGDDGAENIEIGQETSVGQIYSEFQQYLKNQKQLGVLLSVISKNERDTALSGLKRPDSVLKEEDFVEICANWEPKDRNLKNIASHINLLPESFVFVDDNPAEREIVRANLPGTSVPELSEPEHYISVLDRSGFFEVTQFSDDDLKRNAMYIANAKRQVEEASFENYEDYLVSLEMKGEIREFVPVYMSRIAQLTNKSNQFNLTTQRYSQAEIEAVATDGEHITLYGKLEDKFGDNGVVSVVIGKKTGTILNIELWIMSCRVLKRDMEFAMMDELVARCKEQGIENIMGYYYPTAKNAMVKDFFKLQGFELIKEDEAGNRTWRFDIPKEYTAKNRVISVIAP